MLLMLLLVLLLLRLTAAGRAVARGGRRLRQAHRGKYFVHVELLIGANGHLQRRGAAHSSIRLGVAGLLIVYLDVSQHSIPIVMSA